MKKLYAGLHFRRDDDCGIAKIHLYNISKSVFIEQNVYVDLYISSKDADLGEYEDFIYWIKLPYPEDSYEVTVEHSTFNNVNATGPDYKISFVESFYYTPLEEAEVETTLTSWHTDYEGAIYNDTLSSNSITELNRITTLNSSTDQTVFEINGESDRVEKFLEFSDDYGVTWYSPNDINITWGSNPPDFNDKIIYEGHFGINFLVPPGEGYGRIMIKWKPKRDKAYIVRTIKMPNDGISYEETRNVVRLFDDGFEFIG